MLADSLRPVMFAIRLPLVLAITIAFVPMVHADEPTPVVSQATPVSNLAWLRHSHGLITTGKFNGLGQWMFTVGGGSKLVACELNQMTRLPNHANSMAVGGKPERIVLGTNIGTVVLRDGDTLQEIKTLSVGPKYSVYAVAIDVEGKQIAACRVDGTVLVWNVDDDDPVHHLKQCSREGERMAAIAFSPDGKSLATLSRYGYLALWDLETGKSLGMMDHAGGEQSTLRFTPDGHRVAIVNRASIRLWHPVFEAKPREVIPPEEVCPRYTEKENETLDSRPDFGHDIRFAGIATLSPDAKRIASVLETGGIAIWDLSSLKVLQKLSPPPFVETWEHRGQYFERIAFSPDGSKIAASTSLGHLAVWQVE